MQMISCRLSQYEQHWYRVIFMKKTSLTQCSNRMLNNTVFATDRLWWIRCSLGLAVNTSDHLMWIQHTTKHKLSPNAQRKSGILGIGTRLMTKNVKKQSFDGSVEHRFTVNLNSKRRQAKMSESFRWISNTLRSYTVALKMVWPHHYHGVARTYRYTQCSFAFFVLYVCLVCARCERQHVCMESECWSTIQYPYKCATVFRQCRGV